MTKDNRPLTVDQRNERSKVQGLRSKVILAGVDEAGRGPLAGPVVAAAVILPENHPIEGITDSKKLTEKKRDTLFALIMAHAQVGVGLVSHTVIDQINILQATFQACGKLLPICRYSHTNY